MADQIYHKLINENIKMLCNDLLPNEKKDEKKKEYYNNMNINCSSKCEELCNNINDRLQKIKDIVHLRSTKANGILIETLNYIKEYIKEIEKYIQIFNKLIYEENRAYLFIEEIFNTLENQNQNIQKIYNICSKNIVITKNNNELILKNPKACSSLSYEFVNNLMNSGQQKNNNNNNNNNNKKEQIVQQHNIENQGANYLN
ncbi:hypothetical protein PFMG_03383 [Plasmodium falciparum IGH-CR14]|uniref:Uncharacterized protein n=1 Tax=Plasmodium falciparum IGH-CR14 TaxID=580059 RepID=A0A0L1IC37_PLAFA|nr:hypothetical protein PFMG_03383 [Plasmodium falciparum IGH-CR14]